MTDIPRARLILKEIQEGLTPEESWIDEKLEEALGLMTRKFGKRKAPSTSVPVTPELAHQIRQFATINTTKTQAEIGYLFGVNPGRVSEVLRGAA